MYFIIKNIHIGPKKTPGAAAETEYRVQEYLTKQPCTLWRRIGLQIKGDTVQKGNQKSSASLTNMKVTSQVTVWLFLHYQPAVESFETFQFVGFPVFAPCRGKLCSEGRIPQGAPQWRLVRHAAWQTPPPSIILTIRNPCGAGVKPTTCTCADGTTVEPGWVGRSSRTAKYSCACALLKYFLGWYWVIDNCHPQARSLPRQWSEGPLWWLQPPCHLHMSWWKPAKCKHIVSVFFIW